MPVPKATFPGRCRSSWLSLFVLISLGSISLVHAQATGAPPSAATGASSSSKARSPGATQSSGKSAAKAPVEASDAARTDGGSQLRQRIDQLEEQINEMHVAVGTLESFAKSGAARATSSPASMSAGGTTGGDASARLDGMESRLRALTNQMEQMAQQIRALEGRAGRPTHDRGEIMPAPGTRTADARRPVEPHASDARTHDEPSATTDRGSDAIGGLIRGPGNNRDADVGSAPLPPIGAAQPGQARQQQASLTTGTGNPREVYDRAYGSLLRQDYAGAEVGFGEFLAQFPNHELSGNAQYWLGESLYVRGQYKPAANAFLKGYQTYPKSAKGPDSLLKLGMSLDKLGQREAACSSIGELATRFPTAPAHIRSRAQSERARLGC